MRAAILVSFCVAVAALLAWLAWPRDDRKATPADQPRAAATNPATQDAGIPLPPGMQPGSSESTAAAPPAPAKPREPAYKTHPPMPTTGVPETVKASDKDSEAASVREALGTGTHPERVSVFFPPKEPFDQKKFESDPDSYLKTVEPGRVFKTAQPGPTIPALKAEGETFVRLKSNDKTKLSVVGAPGAPVTFTAFDLGAFEENKLNSVTVKADKKGKANATFVAAPGAMDACRVLAGSPVASGQVKFIVEVAP
jgi:hypothetical protein